MKIDELDSMNEMAWIQTGPATVAETEDENDGKHLARTFENAINRLTCVTGLNACLIKVY